MVVQKQKSSGVAAILSFFWCGLGQIYNGQIAKGLFMMIFYPPLMWFGIVLSFFGAAAAGGANNSSDQAAGAGAAIFGLGLLAIGGSLWVFGMVNAYRTAERLNEAQLGLQ
jgi:TM2 domain-containing membrane protein YozV